MRFFIQVIKVLILSTLVATLIVSVFGAGSIIGSIVAFVTGLFIPKMVRTIDNLGEQKKENEE
jgi:fucose permease